jgi:hypothetical protein
MLGRSPSELHGAIGADYEVQLRAILAGDQPADVVVTGELPAEPGAGGRGRSGTS